jgi:hypothetical protein
MDVVDRAHCSNRRLACGIGVTLSAAVHAATTDGGRFQYFLCNENSRFLFLGFIDFCQEFVTVSCPIFDP